MKMVKSLLLGSAAGLVAVAGAQAADLPVKAKAVEYVKVCSLYGAGFYYIPGTDTCIKIGGFVRTEWLHNAGGSFATNIAGANAYYTRNSATFLNRSRGLVSVDTRSQTEFGTLRSYLRAGWQWTTTDVLVGGSGCASAAASSSSCVYLDRAFIQLAGFTFGKTISFYDNFNMAAYSLSTITLGQDSGGTGAHVFAYTAQLGNGVSASLSIEDQMTTRAGVIPIAQSAAGLTAAFPFGAVAGGSLAHANETPDIVGSWRVDQAWGSAQVQGALHLNQATYYAGNTTAGATTHPDAEWGWAVGAGFMLKMPWSAKDTLSAAVNYCEGAVKYCSSSAVTGASTNASLVNTTSVGLGWTADSYFGTTVGNQLQLSQAFSVTAAFEHYWTPTLRQSVYGSYLDYEANSAVVSSLCTLAANVAQTGGAADCADWSAYQIGSRVLWNPVANLDVGLDVMYSHIDTAFRGGTITNGAGILGTAVSGLPTTMRVEDTHVWSGVLRLQRNFWP